MWSVVDEWIIKGIDILQAYGWYVLFTLIGLYFAQPTIAEMRAKFSLAQAQAPARVRVLDEERQRVRLRQQLELLTKKRLGGGEAKDE